MGSETMRREACELAYCFRSVTLADEMYTCVPVYDTIRASKLFVWMVMAIQNSSKAFLKVPNSPIHVHENHANPAIIPIPTSHQPPCTYPHIYPSFTPPLTMPPCIIHHTPSTLNPFLFHPISSYPTFSLYTTPLTYSLSSPLQVHSSHICMAMHGHA